MSINEKQYKIRCFCLKIEVKYYSLTRKHLFYSQKRGKEREFRPSYNKKTAESSYYALFSWVNTIGKKTQTSFFPYLYIYM